MNERVNERETEYVVLPALDEVLLISPGRQTNASVNTATTLLKFVYLRQVSGPVRNVQRAIDR